jgi:VanZ family protein
MKSFRYYWPVTLWAFLILALTGLPGSYFPKVPTVWDLLEPDKIIHLLIFLVLTVLMLYGAPPRQSAAPGPFWLAFISIGTGVVFGGLTELLQAYIFVWRQASVYDFIADAAGSIAGYVLYKQVLIKHFGKYMNHS